MRITSIGHAGLYIETAAGRILCDPWFTPAYFASWIPFPDNSGLDIDQLAKADYLYVSHLHRDHYDPTWLKRNIPKDVTVLLPDYPVPHLRDALGELGFRHFVQTRDNQITELDGGLRVVINALTSPTDGPIGDSALLVDDGRVRVFNQNDARPTGSEAIDELGPLHGHFLQYSGAIWYPMVYDFPERMKQTVGRRKRLNGMTRALDYIEQYGASHIFPFAGPPCFLDRDLFHLNDLTGDEANVFPDQFAFLGFLKERGQDNVHLFLPGTVVELTEDHRCTVEQIPDDEVARIQDRESYLLAYQDRTLPVIEDMQAALPQDRSALLDVLKEWIEPLLADAPHTCAGVNGRILLEVIAHDGGPDDAFVFDFLERTVKPYSGQECRYRFRAARPLVEQLVRSRTEDWVNELFLSCRFEASRQGPYNEYVYTFFKSLSEARMEYVEGYYAGSTSIDDYVLAEDYVVQRYCPHLKADLARFGTVDAGVLTCRLHGWEFELATGRCLTSDDRKLSVHRRAPIDTPQGTAEADYPRVDGDAPSPASPLDDQH